MNLTRAAGVSHYTQADLEPLLALGKGAPAVNQCEMCVGNHDDATMAYCRQAGVTYEAFGPLRSVDLADGRLAAIAAAHGASAAQVGVMVGRRRVGCAPASAERRTARVRSGEGAGGGVWWGWGGGGGWARVWGWWVVVVAWWWLREAVKLRHPCNKLPCATMQTLMHPPCALLCPALP
jgi:hypothetical protein